MSRSDDGGRHWRLLATKGQTRCVAGRDPKAADPAVAWGRDGYSYFVSNPGHVANNNPQEVISRIPLYRFDFAGATAPMRLVPAPRGYNDRPTLTVNARDPERIYIGWVHAQHQVMLARSADRGRSWQVRRIYTGPAGLPGVWGVQAFAVGPGRLVVTYRDLNGGDWSIDSLYSSDNGRSWRGPTRIASLTPGVSGTPGNPNVGGVPYGLATLARGGAVDIVWVDNTPDGRGHIFLSRSVNGGRSWSAPLSMANRSCNALFPEIAVNQHGVIAISYDAYRQCQPGQSPLADVWFAASTDNGKHWRTARLAGPFNMRSAVQLSAEAGIPGAFVGDYTGLAATGNNFAAITVLPRPYARIGKQDVFVRRITVR